MLRLVGLIFLLIGLVLSIGVIIQPIKAEGYFSLLILLCSLACFGAAKFFFGNASNSGLG